MFKLVLAIMCALLIAFFAIQNAVTVTITFLLWKFQTSLVLVILGSAALGAIVIFLFGTLGLIKQKRDLKEANHRIHQLEMEIERHRKPQPTKSDGIVLDAQMEQAD